MKKVIFLMIFISLAAWNKSWAQDDPFDPIIKAIQKSDAKSLSASFNLTIELKLPDDENTFSASQAEMIMKDFFKKYPPDSFTVIQKGTTNPVSKFLIGNYLTGSKQYQVYIDLRKEEDLYLIHKIKFEEKK